MTVLGPADQDLVELCASGALTGRVAVPESWADRAGAPDGRIVLTDAQSTPLAVFRPDVPGGLSGRLEPASDESKRLGSAWDPAVRRTAADIRAEVAKRGARAAVAVGFTQIPTEADLARAAAAIGAGPADAVLGAALAAREGAGCSEPGALARSVLAAKPEGAIGLVIPTAGGPGRTLTPLDNTGGEAGQAEVLSAYGANRWWVAGRERGAGEAGAEGAAPPGFAAGGRADLSAYPPASAEEIARWRRRAARAGAFVLFTGLSGSGKSTVARALAERLGAETDRVVTLLDGDEVRRLLSAGLGFDRAGREANLERIAYVGTAAAAAGAIVLAAPIAPFEASRAAMRRRVEAAGARFILVHVATSLEASEARDVKGLYAKARAGRLPDFTGITSPYEPPADADAVIDTEAQPLAASVQAVWAALPRELLGSTLPRGGGQTA
ncbi:MAG: adenylyl-sulfate kinase [Bifidobacteriaceae bacterium]|jgi:sulfate adenylyltransferase|nr:adenylyl-sulfate kinase [Bifidobacteriaceae bacterium]